MDLWVRSQDKKLLEKVNGFEVVNESTIQVNGFPYGTYATEERALEVLDEINSCIQTNAGFDIYSKLGAFANGYNEKYSLVPVYQMPKE